MSLQVIPASQRLSFDILWHLFGYVCFNDPLGPMSVSQVSQLWRLVALLSPFVWCNITIHLNTATISKKHFLALAYLKRSHNFPIALTIHATRPFKSWEKIELLQPHAHRFHSLHVKASTGYLANLLWMEINMPMPRLEAFDTVISHTSRISINRNIATIDENLHIIPPVCHLNVVHWDFWNTTGLTSLTLDTTCLWNKPDLDDIYCALATTCHTLQHFEYQGLIACIENEVNSRTRLVFPALRSLAVLSHDDMVPLLKLMIIPDLDSLTLRDFMVYPAIPTIPVTETIDIDELTITSDPDGLFQVIKPWTGITQLKIFGIDDLPSEDLSPPPELLRYIKSLNQLSSLVLYGIGAATSIAYTIFMHDPMDEPPLLPKLSRFLLAIVEMSSYDDLSQYLITRQRHQLPRLQKLSINSAYIQHLSHLNRLNILCNSSDEIFVFADPEVGEFIPIKEVKVAGRVTL